MAEETELPHQKSDKDDSDERSKKPDFNRQDSAAERRALYAQKQDAFNDSKDPRV